MKDINKIDLKELVKEEFRISSVINTKGHDYEHINISVDTSDNNYDIKVEVTSDGDFGVSHLFNDTSWVTRVSSTIGKRSDLVVLDKVVRGNKLTVGFLDLGRD